MACGSGVGVAVSVKQTDWWQRLDLNISRTEELDEQFCGTVSWGYPPPTIGQRPHRVYRYAKRKCVLFRPNEMGILLPWIRLEPLFPQKAKHDKNRWSQYPSGERHTDGDQNKGVIPTNKEWQRLDYDRDDTDSGNGAISVMMA
jgi:hypothetical protein